MVEVDTGLIFDQHRVRSHPVQAAGGQIHEQVLEGLGFRGRAAGAVEQPGLGGGLRQGGGVPVLQHRRQTHTDGLRQQLLSKTQRLQQEVTALGQVT